MRVLFTNPPWHDQVPPGTAALRGVRAGSRWPHQFQYCSAGEVNGHIPELIGGYIPFPIWLATAAALAKQHGHEAEVRDSVASGETYETFYAHVARMRPEVVVLETATPTLRHDLAVVDRIREILGEVVVILTGMHFELEQAWFLDKYSQIDYTVYGEYEHSTIALIDVLSGKTSHPLADIGGLVWRNNGVATKNPFGKLVPLENLPWCERDDLPMDNYYDGVCGLQRPQLQLMATRGCPYGCTFCGWPQMLYRGPKYRVRTAEDVAAEIKANLAKRPYKSFYIDDDTVNLKKSYILELAKAIKDAGLHTIPWGTMGRADLMDEEMLAALKDAGLFSIKYGVETADQALLNEIKKNIKISEVIEGVEMTKKYGIKVHLTFTFGLPSDTPETIERTIQLACRLPVDTVQFSITTPYPGTKMYEQYKANGWLLSENWEDYLGSHKAVSRTANFTAEQLEDAVRDAYSRFWQEQAIRQLRTPEFEAKLRAGLKDLPAGARVLVTQSARPGLTRIVAASLETIGYEAHVLTHERFLPSFENVIAADRLHGFNESFDFRYTALLDRVNGLAQAPGFAAAVVPYNNATGANYDEVHKVAAAAAGGVLIGVTVGGEVIAHPSAPAGYSPVALAG
jgi:radical SAM superfamily enzyme YgiQ (UPF0313 family)